MFSLVAADCFNSNVFVFKGDVNARMHSVKIEL